MHRSVRLMGCITVILFGGVLEAHAQFTIRAAAADPVPGWQKMEAGDHSVWVSPTASLTSADIGHFQQITDRDGRTAISIFFTCINACIQPLHPDRILVPLVPFVRHHLSGETVFYHGADRWASAPPDRREKTVLSW